MPRGSASHVTPNGGGSVSAGPPPNCATDEGLYAYGTAVTLTAAANSGYAFAGWGGDASGTAAQTTIHMTGAHAVTATFAACFPLITGVLPTGGGTVSSNPAPNCQGGGLYNPGTRVQLTARPATNYAFDEWSGGASGTLTQTAHIMNASAMVTANFQGCVPVTAAVDPAGAGSAGVATAHDCPGGGSEYAPGSTVALTTTSAGPYYLFDHWTATGAKLSNAGARNATLALTTTAVTAIADYDVCKKLSLVDAPPGDGTVAASPSPNCGGDRYLPGTQVTLTAQAKTGFAFAGWSGDASGSKPQASLSMDSDHSVTASFAVACFALAGHVTPNGGGSVSGSPAANCATDEGLYTYGTAVTLTATASSGYAFAGWSGDASGTAAQTTIHMTGAHAVTATFAACFPLITGALPSGSGTVSSNPAPNCQGGGLYNPGTRVQLTARPATNYAFDEWSGGASGSLTQTVQIMDASASVTANFQGCVAVTAAVEPAGAGSAGVATAHDCPGGGSEYAPGSTVALTTTSAGPYYLFDHWTATGGLSPRSPSSASSTLQLGTDDVTATAEYSTCQTLTTSAVPESYGSVSASPAPNCGGDRYVPGTEVTLTATPVLGHDFLSWIGPLTTTVASTTTNPVQIVMDTDTSPYAKSLYAIFQGQVPVMCYALATSADPTSAGTVSFSATLPPYYNYNPCANGTYPPATQITLSAASAAGYAFQGWAWTGNNSSPDNPGSIVMDGDETVIGSFAACVALATQASPAGDNNTVLESPLPNCEGGGTDLYNPGTQVLLTAWPGFNFAFDHWSGNASGQVTQTTVSLSQPYTATANFLGCVAVTTAVHPPGAASAGVATPHDCPGGALTYAPNSQVALTSSLPFTYAVFSRWTATGASPLSAGTPNITLALTTTGATATAHYNLCHRLSLATVPANGSGGSISASPEPDCGGNYYLPGTQVTLTAGANTGFVFVHWSGDASGTGTQVTLTMDADRSAGADFQVACFGLTTQVAPTNGGSVAASPPTCTIPSGLYAYGTPMTLTATALPGFTFTGWSGDSSSSLTQTTVSVTGPVNITATFAACVALTTQASPGDGGQVLADPEPNCQASGGAYTLYRPGTQVQLTAQPAANFAFDDWSGNLSQVTQTTVSLSQPYTATANFLGCVAVTTAVDPPGAASAGVATPHDCPGGGLTYAPNSQVALTSSLPFTYTAFSHWTATGASPLSAGTPNITLALTTTGATATAHYSLCYQLSLATMPADGSEGTASAQPPPDTNCGGDYYLPGTQVTLTAQANPGFVFTGWSGDATGILTQTVETMTQDEAVTATFTAPTGGAARQLSLPNAQALVRRGLAGQAAASASQPRKPPKAPAAGAGKGRRAVRNAGSDIVTNTGATASWGYMSAAYRAASNVLTIQVFDGLYALFLAAVCR